MMMLMIALLTMFSTVSQWDLTCFSSALHSNRSHNKERVILKKLNFMLYHETFVDF